MRAFRLIAQRAFSAVFTASGGAMLALFVMASSAYFAWLLREGEGGLSPAPALWALSAVPFLPFLAAMLTMRLIADERRDGSLDLLLSAAVREREIVCGKFVGAFAGVMVALSLYLLVPVSIPWLFVGAAPSVTGSYLLALLALALQGMLWCSVGVAVSACTSHASLAFLFTSLICAGLPRALGFAASAWWPQYRAVVPLCPFESQAYDFATGLVSSKVLLSHFVWTGFALTLGSKLVARLRFAHRGCLAVKLSSFTAVLLAVVFSVLATRLVWLGDVTVDVGSSASDSSVSPRLRALLENARGELSAICYMPRRSQDFRSTVRMLGAMKNVARAIPGVDVKVEYIDPRWDLEKASRIARDGVPESSVLLLRGRRRETAPASGGEEALAAALQRLLVPQRARTVCFLAGHGEADPGSYDPVTGYSDIARELVGDGYSVSKLDLAPLPAVPADCSVLVVAGPRRPIPLVEREKIGDWLRHGGRILYLAHGAAPELASWGVRVLPDSALPARTSSGLDAIVSPSPDHAITKPLADCSVVLDGPLLVQASDAAVEGGSGVDRIAFTPLLSVRTNEVVAAALQRGVTASDLALRPTRAVVVGCDTFVMNGALGEKGAANRDFMLNAVAWLAGVDATFASSASPRMLRLGGSRTDYLSFAAAAAVAFPLVLFLLFAFVGGRRLHRP